MSPEERQLLQGLFDRMRGNASAPRDREAEQMIADNLRQQPYAPYLLSQTVIVQDQALQAANDRLQQLEQQLQDQQQGQSQGQGGGSFLSGLFGGGTRQPAPPPQQRPTWNQGAASQNGYPPQGGYPPPQQGGPWGGAAQQPAGGGFLRGALGTAAGVAGGVLMADSIRSLFSGSHGMGGLGIASGVPGMGETVNNFFGGSGPQDADRTQDAQQDAADTYGNDSASAADYQQDADQDQDDAQDSDGYSDDV